MARKKSTTRGPQRDAMESWIRTIEPVRTALIRSHPGRAATVDALAGLDSVDDVASVMRVEGA